MNEQSKQLVDDCFLRPVADARATPAAPAPAFVEPHPSRAPLKTELQVLRLSEDSQAAVLETLRHIHGQDFQLPSKSTYKDKGAKLRGGYWKERGQLIVQGGCDYSNVKSTGNQAIDRYRMFAQLKLESYGFHKTHCVEALEACDGDVNAAVELLFGKYFPQPAAEKSTKTSATTTVTEEEIAEMRRDEIAALESIYEKSFEEQDPNSVWLLKFQIDHLLMHSPHEQKKKTKAELEAKLAKSRPAKSTEPCRNLARGKCKYGDKCKYSHAAANAGKGAERAYDAQADPNWFYLEVRFPEANRYPYEAPLMFLKTTCPDIPAMLCLRLTRRIMQEAREIARDEMPSVYTCAELLQQQDELAQFLKRDRWQFPDGKLSLFYEGPDANANDDELRDLPTHYAKGSNDRAGRPKLSREQLRKEDAVLVRKFLDKQTNANYKSMLKTRSSLPAWGMMKTILSLAEQSQVIVISGETGCGKSTQVPQFFLDDWLLQSSVKIDARQPIGHCEVICTQPRRISAIGVAERVADERAERIGNTVGYQIRLENKISSATRLTYCTTGVLLRRLQSDPQLESVSHVIVDEVHERSEESDFLLLILKEILAKRSDLRVILMSATLNARLFSEYFGGAPVLDIPGRTFPVQQFFLEDILDASKFVLEPDSQYCRKLKKNEEHQLVNELEFADVRAPNAMPARSIRDENLSLAEVFARYADYSRATCKTLFLSDPMRINPELVEAVLRHIVDGEHQWPREGTILVFLPGLAEIMTVYEALNDSSVFGPRTNNYVLVPLHSTLTNEEQALVFRKAPPGKRKIVLSTNIAETSVTIDDCVFVVDVGQMKETRFDANRNMESLDLVWVSRANAQQRKGRAGRVMPGIAIHLYTHHRYQHHFIAQPVPEIHRVPLEQLLLRIKTLPSFRRRNIADVIGSIIEPPTTEGVDSAIVRLQDVGAFDEAQKLTALGGHLSALPVDVRIGKLMLFGAMFQCVDAVLTIAACLSYKSPFVAPFAKRKEADAKKKEFAMGNSDHLTVLNAYRRWQVAVGRSKHAAHCYANENYLSTKTLETLVEIKQQFLQLLKSIGFVPGDISWDRRQRFRDNIAEVTGVEMNRNGENSRLLSALLCAALYPNVVKVLTPEKSFQMTAGGAVPRMPLANELRFKTNQDGYVFVHPSSINSVCGHFTSPFLVFQEKVRTGRIYIRECTMVPLLPLVLFSGSELKIELHGGEFVILLRDEWIMMQAASHEVAEMVRLLRVELAQLLEEKIRDPCLNLLHHENGRKIISTIVHLITKE